MDTASCLEREFFKNKKNTMVFLKVVQDHLFFLSHHLLKHIPSFNSPFWTLANQQKMPAVSTARPVWNTQHRSASRCPGPRQNHEDLMLRLPTQRKTNGDWMSRGWVGIRKLHDKETETFSTHVLRTYVVFGSTVANSRHAWTIVLKNERNQISDYSGRQILRTNFFLKKKPHT